MRTDAEVVEAYSDETLAACIADLSGRRWLDDFCARRLEATKAEQSRRNSKRRGKETVI